MQGQRNQNLWPTDPPGLDERGMSTHPEQVRARQYPTVTKIGVRHQGSKTRWSLHTVEDTFDIESHDFIPALGFREVVHRRTPSGTTVINEDMYFGLPGSNMCTERVATSLVLRRTINHRVFL